MYGPKRIKITPQWFKIPSLTTRIEASQKQGLVLVTSRVKQSPRTSSSGFMRLATFSVAQSCTVLVLVNSERRNTSTPAQLTGNEKAG